MFAWFSEMAVHLAIYYVIAFVATFVLFVLLALTVLGLGGHADVDVGGADLGDGADATDGAGVLSVRTVVAFFVGFGWSGAGALEADLPIAVAALISIAVGSIFMGSVYWVMRVLWGMRHSGTMDFRNAIGEIATVYVPLPPNRTAPGQVQVMIQGRLATVQAFSRAAAKIPSQTRVKVVDVVDQHTLLVDTMDAATEAAFAP